jgi:hypothetical protein
MFTYIFRLIKHGQVLKLKDPINDGDNMRKPTTTVYSALLFCILYSDYGGETDVSLNYGRFYGPIVHPWIKE